MASAQLNRLHQPVDVLVSVGPKRSAALNDIGIHTIEDLFYYFPRRYLDRSMIVAIKNLKENQAATVIGRVVQADIKKGRRNRFELILFDGTSYLTCIWFSYVNHWQKAFAIDEWLAVSGKFTRHGSMQIVHPEFDRLDDEKEGGGIHTGKIVPVYPSTESLSSFGLDSRGFRRLLAQVLAIFSKDIVENLPATILEHHSLISLQAALPAIHFPADFDALESARRRLKFDEFFYFQLMLANRRHHQKDIEGISFAHVGEKTRQLLASLPFELTDAQKRVLSEIRVDLKSVRVMNRLLQGDVGSGKTIVALIVMTIAVENGYQAALMAPTEILAEQHFLTLHHRLERLGIHPVLLTGGLKKKERETTLAEIASAKAQIVIGTHALIQESVEFSRLGLIVIDEQHRFGVLQRATLREKGMNPDLLVMTATPIPRTLSMTVYGDLDVSILNQSPVGRKPIITSWRPSSGRRKIYEFVRRQAAAGDQAYIVFPLVEESEKSDLKAAIESYEIMRSTFFKDFSLGLIHGRMTAAEKESIMNAFKAGETHILVSTTVIEVGVDVPNAAVMVVEHAERFGLTQLHQLRGRVGRGEKQSYCILVAYGALSDKTRQRLDIMVETTDGFKIAEKDLELRGPGDYLGTKQSGLPEFVIADVVYDRELLIEARAEAFALYEHQSAAARAAEIGMNNYFAKRYYQDAEFS